MVNRREFFWRLLGVVAAPLVALRAPRITTLAAAGPDSPTVFKVGPLRPSKAPKQTGIAIRYMKDWDIEVGPSRYEVWSPDWPVTPRG